MIDCEAINEDSIEVLSEFRTLSPNDSLYESVSGHASGVGVSGDGPAPSDGDDEYGVSGHGMLIVN